MQNQSLMKKHVSLLEEVDDVVNQESSSGI
jgi:hypothetical protein